MFLETLIVAQLLAVYAKAEEIAPPVVQPVASAPAESVTSSAVSSPSEGAGNESKPNKPLDLVILGESLPVYSEPKAGSTSSWSLNRGEHFLVVTEKEAWIEIKNDRGGGWIPKELTRTGQQVQTSDRGPASVKKGRAGVGSTNIDAANVGASNTQSDRSFGPAKKKLSGYKVNFKAVEELESMHASDKEIQSFQSRGKLTK